MWTVLLQLSMTLSLWSGNHWIDGIRVSVFKGKDSKCVCDSFQVITILKSFGKFFTRILLNGLNKKCTPSYSRVKHSDFRDDRSTMDMIFSVR